MEQEAQLILLRARLTGEEYRALKIVAIQEDKQTSDLVGELIREFLNGKENANG